MGTERAKEISVSNQNLSLANTVPIKYRLKICTLVLSLQAEMYVILMILTTGSNLSEYFKNKIFVVKDISYSLL
jgi:hypothetical protein